MNPEFHLEHPFYDRQDISSLLEKRLKSFTEGYRQNVALLGPEFLGKSLLLKKFVFHRDHGPLIPVYVELYREPFEYFAQRFMGALLYGFLKTKGRAVLGDFAELVSRSRRYIPSTLKSMRLIKRLLAKDRLKESYYSLLALPRLLSEETGLKILLVLDEFDHLNDYFEDSFKELGNELMMQKDTLFIVSSSRLEEAKRILQGKLSLLFGNFETIRIKSLAFQEAREFIQLFLKDIQIKESLVKFLIQLTDGHPYYLHALLERLKCLMAAKGKVITEEIFTEALFHELYLEHGTLHRHFLNKVTFLYQGRHSYLYFMVLLGVALGKRRVRELSHYVERSQSDIKKILNRLVEREVLLRSGSFYTLEDPLFVFWLKHVFEVQKLDLGMKSLMAIEKFKSNLLKAYTDFVDEDKKNLAERLEGLFREFLREDVVELSGKRVRFPEFGEISSRLSQTGRLTSLLAKSPEARWMCQIASSPIGEEEVSEFLEMIEKYKKPIKNRILVALSGIGLNAKLLAQESRIQVWDLRNINFLFDLFGKAKIIPNG